MAATTLTDRYAANLHGVLSCFDRIIITAAPPRVPQPLIDQLKPGGRLVVPEGTREQELVLYTKTADGKLRRESVLPVRFVPMTGEAQKR